MSFTPSSRHAKLTPSTSSRWARVAFALAPLLTLAACSPSAPMMPGPTLPAPDTLVVAGDDLLVLYLNGALIATGDDAHLAQVANATLLPGRNVLAARVINKGGPGGLLLDLPTAAGHIVTTSAWKLSNAAPDNYMDPSFDDRSWVSATSYGRFAELGWKHPLDGFPADSSAEWIAGPELKSTAPLYFRYAFTPNGRGDLADVRSDGFASMPGKGLSTTTGGGRPPGATVTIATSVASFMALVTDDVPRVIHVPEGTLDFRASPRSVPGCLIPCGARDPGRSVIHLPTTGKTCTDLDPAGTAVTTTRDEGRITLGSNKTIVGDGTGAILSGLNLSMGGSSNIILRNLIFENVNPTLLEASDAITIQNAHHVWIDHCTFRRFSDNAIDAIAASSGSTDEAATFITLSWNHFSGANPSDCGGRHPGLSGLQGGLITAHHNWYDQSQNVAPSLRSEILRFHGYNNAFTNITGIAIDLHAGAQALLEANWFNDVGTPFSKESSSLASAPGGGDPLRANIYAGSTAAVPASADAVFGDVALYPYTLDTPESVAGVPAAAGAGPQVR